MTGLWLAIDTATDIASVAVGQPPNTAAGAEVRGARRHATEILRLVDFVLRRADVTVAELEGIVLGDGPGSFTGLRIGWAAAKGLAQEPGLDLVRLPSLMAWVAAAARKIGPAPIAACFDALRGQVYGAMYRISPDHVETLLEPTLGTMAELARAAPERPVLVVGDGAVRHADASTQWSGAAPIGLESLPPSAPLLLALEAYHGLGHPINDPLTAEPVYGRPAEAQARWEAAHGRPLPDTPGRAR